MRYAGSEAYQLDGAARAPQALPRTLRSVEGGRLDARARREVSPALVRIVGILATLAIVLFVAGGVSVALTSGTVALLQSNAAVGSQIKDVSAQNGDLRIERSLLTRADRITRIATQNLGMVYASDAHTIELG